MRIFFKEFVNFKFYRIFEKHIYILFQLILSEGINKATRSPLISRQQVQKLTPQNFVYFGNSTKREENMKKN